MAALIKKWKSGDFTTLEVIFRQYEELVFRTAYLMAGDREKAEDILQEVFIRTNESSK